MSTLLQYFASFADLCCCNWIIDRDVFQMWKFLHFFKFNL
eukprot:UN15946